MVSMIIKIECIYFRSPWGKETQAAFMETTLKLIIEYKSYEVFIPQQDHHDFHELRI